MKNALKILSVCAVMVAATGCACKGKTRGHAQQSTKRSSGRQASGPMHFNAGQGRQSAMRPSPAPGSMHSPSHAAPRHQSAMVTSFAPGSMSTPQRAASGECWSSVYFPPVMKTETDRICLKEPSERYEVSPAEYDWVEEKVCVKQASKQFVVVPARYETVTENVVLDTGHTDWVRADENQCRASGGEAPVSDVFCVVNYPRVAKTVTAERLVQPASIREVEIPAEYQTVRTQRCVKPATSRRVEIPGEYQTVEKTVEVSPGRWEWQRVQCEGQATAQPISNHQNSVRKTSYIPNNSGAQSPK